MGHKVRVLGIIALIIISIGFLIWFDVRIKSSILAIAQAKVQLSETQAINRTINQEVVAKTSYSDLVEIHKDKDGRIVLLQPNTILINKIVASTTAKISESLDQMKEESVLVPLGQISGTTLMSGYGPKIKVKVIPCGQVHVDIVNKFDEAGVNQTRHLIYCQIQTDLKVAVPMMDEDIRVSTTVPLAETIIVGDVPRTYVDYKEKQGMPYSVTNEEQD